MAPKLNVGNIIPAKKWSNVLEVWNGAGIQRWRDSELKEIDRKSRKLLRTYGAHHSRVGTD